MPVTDDVSQFWNRLQTSQILDDATLANAQYAFQTSEVQPGATAESLADWLIGRKTVSRFQADVLLAECSTSLRFGNYTLADRWRRDQDSGQYLARHRLTQHPVLLDFIGGSDAAALASWRQAKDVAKNLSSSMHANLIPVHEAVSLPEYRFVVSSAPQCQRLSERIPEKARLEPAHAALIVGQLAAALHHLHAHGLAHGQVTADVVWIDKSNHVQLQPAFDCVFNDSEQFNAMHITDIRAVSGLWCRLLTGRFPNANQDHSGLRSDLRERLEKFSVPDETAQMILSCFSPSESNRPALDEVVARCWQDASVAAADWPVAVPSPTAAAYQAWLARTPGIFSIDSTDEVSVLDVRIKTQSPAEGLQHSPDSLHIQPVMDPPIVVEPSIRPSTGSAATALSSTSRTKRYSSFSILAANLGSLLAIGLLIAIVVVTTRSRPNQVAVKRSESQSIENATSETGMAEDALENPVDPASKNPGDSEPSATPVALHQSLIDDDGETLWETPTVGENIDFAFVPAAPKIAFAFRPAELLSLDDGQLLLQALGPDLIAMIDNWQQRMGTQLSDIEQLLLTLHSGDDFSFEPFVILRLVDFVPIADLIAAWGMPTLTPAADGTGWYTGTDGLCYYFFDAKPGSDRVREFAAGPQALIQESIELAGTSPLAGSMKTLARWSEVDRQATIMFLRAELFNEAGQQLMGGRLRGLNRQMQLAIDNNIRGGLLSLHLDRGTYLELRFDATADLKNSQLESHLHDLLNQLSDKATAHADSIRADSHWESVGLRFAAMMADFRQSWRVGTERKQVMANAWLPQSAAHNLVAAAELILAFGGQQSTVQTVARTVPATLEELLALPRDLSVKTSPDLNKLIKSLEQEIRGDFGQLPFDFEIRIRGSDLSRDGITQNQRPGDFEIEQQPLSDILTQIMVRANPNKNVSGPSDIECKLVWVIADDPDLPSRKIILITTRTAAAENDWPLPAQFLAE